MKIGILQTGHTPEVLQDEFGDYDELFPALLRDNGFEFVTFAVVDSTFPDGADDADGWIITGSRHGVYEDLPGSPRWKRWCARSGKVENP